MDLFDNKNVVQELKMLMKNKIGFVRSIEMMKTRIEMMVNQETFKQKKKVKQSIRFQILTTKKHKNLER